MQASPFLRDYGKDDPRELDWGPDNRSARNFQFSHGASYYTAAHPNKPSARLPRHWCWKRYTDGLWRRMLRDKSTLERVAEFPLEATKTVVEDAEKVVEGVVRGTERVVKGVTGIGDHVDVVGVHKHTDVLKLHGHRHRHRHRGDSDSSSSSDSESSSSSSSSSSSDSDEKVSVPAAPAVAAPKHVLVMGAMFSAESLEAERALAAKVRIEAEQKVQQDALARAAAAYPSVWKTHTIGNNEAGDYPGVWKTHTIGNCEAIGCDSCGGLGPMAKPKTVPHHKKRGGDDDDDDDKRKAMPKHRGGEDDDTENMRKFYEKWMNQEKAALRLNCGNAFSTCGGGDGDDVAATIGDNANWVGEQSVSLSKDEAEALIAQHAAAPLLNEAAMKAQIKSAIIAGKPLALQFQHSYVARKHAVAAKGRIDAADVQHVHVKLAGRAESAGVGSGHNYLIDVGIAPSTADGQPNEAKRGTAERLFKIGVDASGTKFTPATMMKQMAAFEAAAVQASAVSATRAKVEKLVGAALTV